MRRFLSDRGAEAVEFAFIAPVLLLLVFGIAEFGRAYFVQSMLSAGARDGVRALALHPNTEDGVAEAAAETAATAGASPITPDQITVTPENCYEAAAGTAAQVTLTYKFEFLYGALGSDITLTGKGTMRCFG